MIGVLIPLNRARDKIAWHKMFCVCQPFLLRDIQQAVGYLKRKSNTRHARGHQVAVERITRQIQNHAQSFSR